MNRKKNSEQTETTDKRLKRQPEQAAENAAADTPEAAADAAGEADEKDTAKPTTLQALRNLTADEGEKEEERTRLTLSAVLGGDILGGHWFRKQFWYIVMVVAMLIVYVSNRYSCQQEMIQTKMLSDTLLDRRYKALTRSSQLKEKTRRSYIEETLTDTTLQTANTPSFNLKIEN